MPPWASKPIECSPTPRCATLPRPPTTPLLAPPPCRGLTFHLGFEFALFDSRRRAPWHPLMPTFRPRNNRVLPPCAVGADGFSARLSWTRCTTIVCRTAFKLQSAIGEPRPTKRVDAQRLFRRSPKQPDTCTRAAIKPTITSTKLASPEASRPSGS